MKKLVLFIWVCLAVLGTLSAQQMWPEDVVLREAYNFDGGYIYETSADGGVYSLTVDKVYNHRNLCLYKVNADGNLAWPQPAIICGGDSQKTQFSMFKSSDGNFFIYWQEAMEFRLTKVDPQGQPLWNPAIRTVYQGGKQGHLYKPDNNGGAYLFFGKSTTGGIVDIWGQHVDANGNNLFPGDGVEITSDPRQESTGKMEFTPDGNMLFSYDISESSPSQVYTRLMLLNTSFTPLWQINLTTGSTGVVWRRLHHLYRVSDTEYNLVWVEHTASTAKLYLNRINLQGSFLWDTPVVLAENTVNTSLDTYAAQCSDNSLVISIHFGANMLPTSNYIKRIASDGTNLWANEVSLPDSVVTMIVLRKDDSDGVDFLIRHMVNGNTSNYGYSLQHYSSDGVALYPGCGITLMPSLSNNSRSSFSLKWNNQYFLVWKGANQDKYGLYYCLLNAVGELIGAPNQILREGLNGDTSILKVQNRSDDIVTVWLDTRYPNSSLYYQIVNTDGSFELENGGRLLCSLPLNCYYQDSATVYLENGTTWILYSIYLDGNAYIYGQAISESGDVLYDGAGLCLLNTTNLGMVGNLKAYNQGNAIYLTWSQSLSSDCRRTYIQKIDNGVAQWGASGILMSPSAIYDNVIEYPLCFVDGFLVLVSNNTDTHQKTIWVQHLEPNGQVSPNWNPDGLTICSYYGGIVSISSENAAVYDNNLLVCYHEFDPLDGRYLYYLVDSAGNVGENSLYLQEENFNQRDIQFDTTSGFAYSYLFIPDQYSAPDIAFGKVDGNSNHPWGNLAGMIDPVSGVETLSLQLSGFLNGAYALTWYAHDKLNLRFVTPQGNPHSLLDGHYISEKFKGTQQQTVLNNELYLAWQDYRNHLYNYYLSDLRLQKYGNITEVAVTDNYENPVPLVVSCYPNPFSQSSNFSFKLTSPERCELKIYNLRGQLVKTLLSESKEAGAHNLSWDGADTKGKQVGSGVYFARLKVGNSYHTSKLLRMR